MKKIKITMLDYRFRPSLHEAVKKVNEATNGMLDFHFYDVASINMGLVDLEKVKQDLNSQIVLLNCMGGDNVSKIICDALSNSSNTVVVFVGGSSEIVNLTKLGSFSFKKLSRMGMGKKKVDYATVLKMRERFEKLGKRIPLGLLKHAKNYAVLLKYYEAPTVDNFYAMFLFLMKEYGNAKIDIDIPEPKILPSMGVMNFENQVFPTSEEYLKEYKFRNRPLIGLFFYGGHHHDESYPAAKALTQKLESRGYGVIPVFSSDLRYYLAIEKFFLKNNQPVVEVLIDLLWFRFAGGPMGGDHNITAELLCRLNVPVLHGLQLYSTTIDMWLASKHGLSPIETVTSVILPELDGRIEPVVTHGVTEKVIDGAKICEYTAVEEGVEKLVNRAISWVNLRSKPNSEKKIAVILYNYPPGEENIGKAECLDVFESLSKLLQAMQAKGYTVPPVESGENLRQLFISKGVVNSGAWIQTPQVAKCMIKVNRDTYVKWLQEIPSKPLNRILEEWGPPPGKVMTRQNSLLIPGVQFGNIFVGLQPARGIHETAAKIYHDKDLPPHHQYIAFYKWLKNEFKADTVIHLGTHGTLEFLPGKEVGLSTDCFSDILINDLPNIYVYHAVNSSECAIAKRRSYALIVNHASPPMTISDLHSDYQDLERLILEYFDAIQYNKDAGEISKKVLDKAEKYGLGDTVEEIYDKLEEYKRSLIPKGLHVLGSNLSAEHAIDYLAFLSRYDRGEIKSLQRQIVESKGLSYEELLKQPHKRGPDSKLYSEILAETETEVKKIIKAHVINKESIFQPKHYGLNEESKKSLEFLNTVYERIQQSNEIDSVLNALEGKFVQAGPGGDFIRTPEIFPTGRNTAPIDTTRIPTDSAMERGKTIAEGYIRNYYETYGAYPRVVSVVLWGFETMKTGGETVAAIFHLLGVKPVWKGLYIRDIEIIPPDELNRPRIDVITTICGIFRDTFYNVVELLDKAVNRVLELDETEETNYLKANMTRQVAQHGEAAKFRVFGPPEGQYATSLTTLIESSEWKGESDIINSYLESMKFAYGEKQRSVDAKHVFSALLSNVDLVAQVRDTVDYEVTDLDHYYEFLGGLTKTVKQQRGSKPLVLIADVTKEQVKVEDIKEASKRGIITRTINPKWLDAMLEHGANGASKVADRVEYMLGMAATLESIENWMWGSAVENIVFNKQRAEKMKTFNPWAFCKIVGRFLEANRRGYWKANQEIIKKLEQEYLEVETRLENNY